MKSALQIKCIIITSASMLALADVAKFTNWGRIKRLKIGSVPSHFQWNNWGLPIRQSAYKRASTRLGHDVCPALPLEQPLPCEEEAMEEVAASVVKTEHDYGSAPEPGMSVFAGVLKCWPTSS